MGKVRAWITNVTARIEARHQQRHRMLLRCEIATAAAPHTSKTSDTGCTPQLQLLATSKSNDFAPFLQALRVEPFLPHFSRLEPLDGRFSNGIRLGQLQEALNP